MNAGFSFGEPGTPSLEDLGGLGPFETTEKLDGSLGISFYDKASNSFRISTRGSIDSEHAEWATERFPEALKDPELLRTKTFMFELVTPKYQIVIDYKSRGYKEGLYLIGVRDNGTQRLCLGAEVLDFAMRIGVPTCTTYAFNSIDEVIRNAKALPFSEEGYVLRFTAANELLLKVKSPEYLRVHRFLSNLDDKSLLECLIAGQKENILNDIHEIPEEYRDEVVATFDRYGKEAAAILNELKESFSGAPKQDRKKFAEWVTSTQKKEYSSFLFQMMDGKIPAPLDIFRFFLKVRNYTAQERTGFSRMKNA